MTKHELLKYAVSKGIINLSALETQVEDMERKRYLEMHRFKVWKDSKGYWITHLPDEKRTLIKKWTREELEDVVIKFYRDEEYAPTLRQVFDEWLDKKLDYGEIQRQTYDRYKTDFDRFYIPIAEKKIKSIDEEFLEDYCKKTIHDCRKTYCSKLISAGLDEKLITHQMGHVDISTSEKYYNYNIYDSKETVELITSALG